MTRLRNRLASQEGFTLIELLVVIVIIGILMAIAVPSYLGFRAKAQDASAQSNIRSAVPSAEAYYSEHNTYVGMTTTLMATYDQGLSSAVSISTPAGLSDVSYCLKADGRSGTTFYFHGPGGSIVSSTGAAPTGC